MAIFPGNIATNSAGKMEKIIEYFANLEKLIMLRLFIVINYKSNFFITLNKIIVKLKIVLPRIFN